MQFDDEGLPKRAARLAGTGLADAKRLHGGSLSEIWRLVLADGREVVAKTGPQPRREARMLSAIRAAGAPAPGVVAVDDDVLVIEALPAGGSLAAAGASLGEALRVLHATTGDAYGWADDYAFASVPIPNGAVDDWPTFWAERRLAMPGAALPAPFAHRIQRIAARLRDRLPAAPPAALLHGDLWSGNVLVAGTRVTGLIDPACYYGHGEVDLAMLALFGMPGGDFTTAYGTPEPGFAERRPIYQLWPAIVHVRLFGSAYHPMLDRLLAACGV
jgi:fructosamine-3-kinase